jgi:hypothetical protein
LSPTAGGSSPRVRADAAPAERVLGELLREGLLAPAKRTPAMRAPTAPLPPRQPLAPLADVLRDLDRGRAGR